MSPRRANIARACAELGIIFVAPDTSPRGEGVPDDPEGLWDFGQGAGFYVDATEEPWSTNFRMWTYVTEELPALVAGEFPVDMERQGDHRPFDGRPWRADPRARPSRPVPQRLRLRADRRAGPGAVGREGARPLSRAEGPAWRRHDAVALIEDGARVDELLVDIGEADPFLEKELKPELLERACADAGIPLTLRRQPGYDHSYYFISTFMADHVALARGAAEA